MNNEMAKYRYCKHSQIVNRIAIAFVEVLNGIDKETLSLLATELHNGFDRCYGFMDLDLVSEYLNI